MRVLRGRQHTQLRLITLLVPREPLRPVRVIDEEGRVRELAPEEIYLNKENWRRFAWQLCT